MTIGYTHYLYRPQRLHTTRFTLVVADAKVLAEAITKLGVKLAGPMGTGRPVFNSNRIALNGAENCGHAQNTNIVIPWPAEDASGIAQEDGDAIAGSWFAGATLRARVCNGDCSYETFAIERILKPENWQEPDKDGNYFTCCKTAYRPYDLLVTATLLAAKHHLGDTIEISSDGTDQQWSDTKIWCQTMLGYGADYLLDDSRGLVLSTASEVMCP